MMFLLLKHLQTSKKIISEFQRFQVEASRSLDTVESIDHLKSHMLGVTLMNLHHEGPSENRKSYTRLQIEMFKMQLPDLPVSNRLWRWSGWYNWSFNRTVLELNRQSNVLRWENRTTSLLVSLKSRGQMKEPSPTNRKNCLKKMNFLHLNRIWSCYTVCYTQCYTRCHFPQSALQTLQTLQFPASSACPFAEWHSSKSELIHSHLDNLFHIFYSVYLWKSESFSPRSAYTSVAWCCIQSNFRRYRLLYRFTEAREILWHRLW